MDEELSFDLAYYFWKSALEQPTQEPVAWMETYKGEPNNLEFTKAKLDGWSENKEIVPLYTHPKEQPTQEPVAWMHRVDEDITEFNDFQACPKCEPLYTHPPKMEKVTRLEVIDADGRSYTNWKVKDIEVSYQDDGRTLKIFIK